MNEDSQCFSTCNDLFKAIDPRRIYCKKGCKSDFDKEECKVSTCEKLCVKKEIGEMGEMSKYFSRAPADPQHCLEACILGCFNK